MLAVTKFTNRQTRVGGSKFGRSAVLVGPTDEEHFIAELPAEPRMDISRQQRADKIAEMLDAGHIGNGAGDEKFCHCLRPSSSLRVRPSSLSHISTGYKKRRAEISQNIGLLPST